MLRSVGEVRASDAGSPALPCEIVLDADLALLRPEAARNPVELRVAAHRRPVRGEMPCLLREVLDRYVLQLGAVPDEELRHGVRVPGQLGRRRRVLLDETEPAAFLGDDEHSPEMRS